MKNFDHINLVILSKKFFRPQKGPSTKNLIWTTPELSLLFARLGETMDSRMGDFHANMARTKDRIHCRCGGGGDRRGISSRRHVPYSGSTEFDSSRMCG